jgi:hypothetical protein
MLHTYVAIVLSGCYVWFAMVFKCFYVFLHGFQMHVLSVSSVFRRMLQVLHLDVSKVDWVLNMLQCDPPTCRSPLLLLMGCRCGGYRVGARGRQMPLRRASVGGVRRVRRARSCFVAALCGYWRAFVTGTGRGALLLRRDGTACGRCA